MIKQDREVQIVVCGDLNKQLPYFAKELRKDGLTSVFQDGTVTHQKESQLDQIFVRNLEVLRSSVSENYIEDISDNKIFKVKLGLNEQRMKDNGKVSKDILNPDMFKSNFPQRVLRELANEKGILERMICVREDHWLSYV
jgi:hypothetical protein